MTHLEIMLETKEEKNLVKEIDKLPYISFPYTNENLEAIIKGMQINSEDYVLGIMGSGQQGLAMIEKGAKADLIDYDFTQIEYFRKMLRFLKNNKNSYESCKKILMSWEGPSKNYFSLNERIFNIRKNLDNLKILEKGDIFSLKTEFSRYNKVYLSNSTDYKCQDYLKNQKKFIQFGKNFNQKTTFYLSRSVFESNRKLKKEGFRINEDLTKKSNKIEMGWKPQIIVKDDEQISLIQRIIKKIKPLI
ncbi:hypothetical protein AUJ61_00655 [Candidatus Pacearchaeota archaeon CG1_02_30_18]|nr:hypothetical protein [Candidatus Pacearchaeota archaeon]OIO40954.1 MAG: hypothetical protein AUJ61_00655 [Candidatus Pacearchaeota archaeon CG1_02_30_18]PIN71723.1 MAG: hypothetical protein COV77_00455 [Candidatus Pacearchaeota archaeon CG11_big_fil_rev_8_21_14_0_20_30_13]PIZ81822.1 MAG: hypothetical protein COX98_02300 [Candidatus Pacearchaeota archaeon CG_4_10_14_0_2_um_filter_30_11]PJA71025.1 MAG: hypothetical protein CO153_03625 [Candidatus Pacearchaeota archaeon CG_4_9_14_3_um_filter_30